MHLGRKVLPRLDLRDDARRLVHGSQTGIAPPRAGYLSDPENVFVIPQYLAERMALEARIEIHPVISRLGLSVVISPYDDAGRIRQSCRRIGHLVGLGDIDSGNRNGVRLARLRYDRGLGFHRAREYRRRGDPGRLRSEGLVGRKLDFVVRTVQTDAFDPQRPRIRRQVFLHIDPGYGPQHLDAETIFPVGLQSGRNGDLAVHGQTPSGSRKRASYSGLDLGLRAARRRRISGERIAVIAGQHQFDRLGRTEELGLKLSAVSGRFEPLSLCHIAIHVLAVFLLEHEYHHVLDPVFRIPGQISGSRASCRKRRLRQADRQAHQRPVVPCNAVFRRHLRTSREKQDRQPCN